MPKKKLIPKFGIACRKRHVKCIETRPERPECFRLHLTCEWITAASPANSLNRTHVSPHPTPTKATDRSGLSQGSDDGSTEVGVIGYDVGHIRSGDYGDSGGEGTVLPICTTYDFSPPQLEAMYENRNHHDGFIISSSSTQVRPYPLLTPSSSAIP